MPSERFSVFLRKSLEVQFDAKGRIDDERCRGKAIPRPSTKVFLVYMRRSVGEGYCLVKNSLKGSDFLVQPFFFKEGTHSLRVLICVAS
ncbi:hypothetical protein D3C75_990980 [compost metagenome]